MTIKHSLTALLFASSSLVFANQIVHVQTINGVKATQPIYSPTLKVDYFNTVTDTTPCFSRTVTAENHIDDYAGGAGSYCKSFGKVEIIPLPAATGAQVFAKTALSVMPHFENGNLNNALFVTTKTQPIFAPDGSVETQGTISVTNMPWTAGAELN